MVYVEASVRRTQLVSAARSALERHGVAGTSLRAVATEAEVPLGTLQYVFPSKEQLLRAVIEDVVDEIAAVLAETTDLEHGLAHAIRSGFTQFWERLVVDRSGLQLMQYELVTYALRTPGQEALARWQYERYGSVVADWCQQAAHRAGETCAVPFARLARVMLATVDGLIVQYVADPHQARARADLDVAIDMFIALTGARETTTPTD
ncbi:TetR/AcrR family transcriptional regulator [Nocardia sp. NPDC050718]|uniref:TetR/AcrR family transcriptional regulator n=1 Tax=unclassified Nocardia TaxID=2637762 RepID=UPI0033C3BE80